MRTLEFKVYVLRNGVRLTELMWMVGSEPVMTISRDAELHRSMQGTFEHNPLVDYITDELQPVAVISGIEQPIATLIIGSAKKTMENGIVRVNIEAYDRALRLKNNRCTSIYHITQGTNYISAVREILSDCGIVSVSAQPTANTLPTDREFLLGTDFLSICNELLAEINYDSVDFDGTGLCVLKKHVEPSASAIKWRYGNAEQFSVLQHTKDSYTEDEDIFDAPNVFVCTCANPDMDEDMVATSENANPSSKKSTFARKMRIVQVTNVENIASQTELQAYADRLRNESLWSSKKITFTSLYDGNHASGDVVAISNEEISGIYLETSVEWTLADDAMLRHTARKAVMT